MARVSEGDVAAFAQLYERTWVSVYAAVLRVLRCPDHAAEVTQEVYAAVWSQIRQFDPLRGRAAAWIATMARHRAIDRVRRLRVAAALDARWARESAALDGNDEVWHQVAGRLDGERVLTALAALVPAKRQVIALTFLSGLTQAQVAGMLGVPLGTVKSRTRDGLAALRRDLQLEA